MRDRLRGLGCLSRRDPAVFPGPCEWGLPGATRHGPPTIQARAELTSRPVRVLLPTAHADGVLAVVAAVYVEFDVRVLAQALVVCSELNGAAFRTRAHAFRPTLEVLGTFTLPSRLPRGPWRVFSQLYRDPRSGHVLIARR